LLGDLEGVELGFVVGDDDDDGNEVGSDDGDELGLRASQVTPVKSYPSTQEHKYPPGSYEQVPKLPQAPDSHKLKGPPQVSSEAPTATWRAEVL
jgi:hypothetical protein